MVVSSILIKPHLAEYANSVFAVEGENYIKIPHKHDLYHLIYDLMCKRPINVGIRKGNLHIALPSRAAGKCPEVYNYISDRATMIIESKIEVLFWAHVHDFIDERHHLEGYTMSDGVYCFMKRYGITAISEDALTKNYYRWRASVRRKRQKRKYNSTNSSN